MASVSDIKNEIDAAVNAATSVADLAERFAAVAEKFSGSVPGVGPEVAAIAGFIDVADKLLHNLQNLLG